MALLKAEAEKLSNNMLVQGIIESIVERDDLFKILPFTKIEGKAYVYNREKTISAGAFIDPNEEVAEGAATFDEIITKLKVLAGDVDVDKFLDETMSDTSSQLAIQIAAKAKGLAQTFKTTLATGDATTNPKEFDGLLELTPAAQVIDGQGAGLTLEMMDELSDKVKIGADAFVMRPGTVRAYRALLRAAGGTAASEIMMENFGHTMLTHNGIPIIVNEYLPTEDHGAGTDNVCSVYAVKLSEADGLHGIYGGSGGAGIKVESVGTVQNKDASRTRVKWYCGLALKSIYAIARLKNVTNI